MATLKVGELYSGLQGHEPVVYAVTHRALCPNFQITKLAYNAIWFYVNCSLLNNSGIDGRGLSVCWNPDCRCHRFLPKSRRLLFAGFLPLQRTHLQPKLLRKSLTAGDETTSRERNPENGRSRDFGRRAHRQSGFQHTERPRPSSPELFNKDHNAGRENLSHLIGSFIVKLKKLIIWSLTIWCYSVM